MLNEDYKDILSALLAHEAEFILVGAYAMAAHGFPRATMDIDIWIEPDAGNAPKVYAALATFGAPTEQISIGDLSEPGVVFQIGVAPRRIDLLTSISGVEFRDAYASAAVLDLEGLDVRVLSLRHLVTNKKATGRAKDLADIESLRVLGDGD